MNAVLTTVQVSLLHALNLPTVLSPNTLRRCRIHLVCVSHPTSTAEHGSSPDSIACATRADISFAIDRQARYDDWPNRVHLRYGPAVHLPMLSTPPRGDAVSVGYRSQTIIP